MQSIRVLTMAVLALTACGNKDGASLVPGDGLGEPDRVAQADVPARPDTAVDATPDCGECPWDRTCSDEGVCVPHPCQSTKDCPGDLVCAQELGDCVHCVGPEDCKEGLFCGADHRCHETYACTSDKDCKDYEMVCDKEAEICVQCLTVLDCGDGEYCEAGFCLAAACEVGTAKCVGDEVHGCPDGKEWVVAQTCTEKQYCEEGECKDLLCESGEVWCEEDVYKVCAADGKTVQYEEDCGSNGKHCFAGACIDTLCVPDSTFCVDGDTAAACTSDGMNSVPADCPGQHFCKVATGTCQPWACEPGLATCQGSTATVCDAIGSGLASQTDCAGLGKQCSAGQCVDCQPQCQQKECGENGCGGSCGSCGEDEACVDEVCVPELPDCPTDKNCADLECGLDAVCGEPCGECPEGQSCDGGKCVGCVKPTGSKTFEYTGQMEEFIVPKCVSEVAIEAWGAAGQNDYGAQCEEYLGKGGFASCQLSVQTGEVLLVSVGQHPSCGLAPGGWNGGGWSGGGGASDIRKGGDDLEDRVVVAAGGGAGRQYVFGGSGGGLKGEVGQAHPSELNAEPGQGGTQDSGGIGGSSSPTKDGKFGSGGGTSKSGYTGGGGGWYGGGAGYKAGGGGGSSYFGGCVSGSTQDGVKEAHGKIVISW